MEGGYNMIRFIPKDFNEIIETNDPNKVIFKDDKGNILEYDVSKKI